MSETALQDAARKMYWPGIAACSVSAYALALQNNAMNVAGPVLAQELSVGISDVSAVTLVYTVPIAATLIAGGRMGDVFGARRMFRVGMALYLVGSTLCGMATGLGLLLVVRVLQSVGATLVVSNQLALVSRSVGAGRRGEAFGIINFMAYAGQVSGPVIGGLITGALGWRWLFWMNIPLALWLLLWGINKVPPDSGEGRERSLDIPGAALFAAAIGGLLVAANRSPLWGVISPQVIALVAVSIAFGAAFVARELRTSDPMLDLRLFQHRDFSAAIAGSIANFVANSGLVLLLPFYLVDGHGLTVDRAGMALVPLSLLMALIAPVSGRLGDRIGPRLPSTVGMLLLCIGTGALAVLPVYVPLLGVIVLTVVAGTGIGLFTSTNTTAIMAAVPQDRLGVAGGIVHTARYIGLTGGVALAGAVYALVAQHDAGAEGLGAYRAAFGVLAAIAAVGAGLSAITRGRTKTLSSSD